MLKRTVMPAKTGIQGTYVGEQRVNRPAAGYCHKLNCNKASLSEPCVGQLGRGNHAMATSKRRG